MKKFLLVLTPLLILLGCQKDPKMITPPTPPGEIVPWVPEDGFALTVDMFDHSETGIKEITTDAKQNAWVIKTKRAETSDPGDLATVHDPWFFFRSVNNEPMDFSKYNKLQFKMKGFSHDEQKRQQELGLGIYVGYLVQGATTGIEGLVWGANGFMAVDPIPAGEDDWQTFTIDLTKIKTEPTNPWTCLRVRPGLDPAGDVWYIKDVAILPGNALQGPLDYVAVSGNAATVTQRPGKQEWDVAISADANPNFFFESAEKVDFARNKVLEFEVLNNAAALPLAITLGADYNAGITSTDWTIPVVGANNWEKVICNISDLTLPTTDVLKLRIGTPANQAASLAIRNIKMRPLVATDPMKGDPIPLTIREEGAEGFTIAKSGDGWSITPAATGTSFFYLAPKTPINWSPTHQGLYFEVKNVKTPISQLAISIIDAADWAKYGIATSIAAIGDEWTTIKVDMTTRAHDGSEMVVNTPIEWVRFAIAPDQTRPTEAFEIRNIRIGPKVVKPLPTVGLKIGTDAEIAQIPGTHPNTLTSLDVVEDGVWKITWGETANPNFFIISDTPVALKGQILAMDIRNADVATGVVAIQWNDINWDNGFCSQDWGMPAAGAEWKTVYFDLTNLTAAPAEWRFLKFANTDAQKASQGGRSSSFEVTNIRMIEAIPGVALKVATNAEATAAGGHANTLDDLDGNPETFDEAEILDDGWKITWGATSNPNFFFVTPDGLGTTTDDRILTMQIRNASPATGIFCVQWDDVNWNPSWSMETPGWKETAAQWVSVYYDISAINPAKAPWKYIKTANTLAQKEASGRSDSFEIRNIAIINQGPIPAVQP